MIIYIFVHKSLIIDNKFFALSGPLDPPPSPCTLPLVGICAGNNDDDDQDLDNDDDHIDGYDKDGDDDHIDGYDKDCDDDNDEPVKGPSLPCRLPCNAHSQGFGPHRS